MQNEPANKASIQTREKIVLPLITIQQYALKKIKDIENQEAVGLSINGYLNISSNKIYFELTKHIQENWQHYNSIFQINKNTFRNDWVFSIAVHIMNGYQRGDFSHELPGKLYFTSDKDILWELSKLDSLNIFFPKVSSIFITAYPSLALNKKSFFVFA